jgi:hypothetical protein
MERWITGAVVSALLAAPMCAQAGDDPAAPTADEDFLEYLGSWDGDEEDWLVVERHLPPPAGEGWGDGSVKGGKETPQEQGK